jgi:hypothetical protein
MSFLDRIRGSLDYGLSWYAELKAQEAVINSMGKLLGDKYIVLHNITLPDADVTIPLILIGPTGVYILYVTSLGGVYRAKADAWMVQESGRGFKTARPNLLTLTQLMGRGLQVYLKRSGVEIDAQAVLVCVSSDMFVESIRPMVRVILSDAIEKFIASLAQSKTSLEPDTVRRIADLLSNPPKPVDEKKPEEIAPVEIPEKKKNTFLAAFGKVNFTPRQWFILGILQVLLVCLLITFIATVIIFK